MAFQLRALQQASVGAAAQRPQRPAARSWVAAAGDTGGIPPRPGARSRLIGSIDDDESKSVPPPSTSTPSPTTYRPGGGASALRPPGGGGGSGGSGGGGGGGGSGGPEPIDSRTMNQWIVVYLAIIWAAWQINERVVKPAAAPPPPKSCCGCAGKAPAADGKKKGKK